MIGHTPKYPPELSSRLAHDAVSLAYMCDIGGWTPAYVRQFFYELPQITTKHFYNHHQSSFSLHCIAIIDVMFLTLRQWEKMEMRCSFARLAVQQSVSRVIALLLVSPSGIALEKILCILPSMFSTFASVLAWILDNCDHSSSFFPNTFQTLGKIRNSFRLVL